MSDQKVQFSNEELLASIRREAEGFLLPGKGGAPRRMPLALAIEAGEAKTLALYREIDVRLDAANVRLDVAAARSDALDEALRNVWSHLRVQDNALNMQRRRAADLAVAEGDVRLLRDRVGALAAAIEARKAVNDFTDPQPADHPAGFPLATAPRGKVAYWPRLLLETGDAFLSNAYRVLLDRPIDAQGLESYRGQMAQGRERLEVLCDIALSEEFRKRGIADARLERYRRVHRIARKLERTPARFLARIPRAWLRSHERELIAGYTAEVAASCRNAVAALFERFGAGLSHGPNGPVLADDGGLDAFRQAFLNEELGSVEQVRARLSQDLERVAAVRAYCDGPVFDLASGRGEWLSLLREHGYEVRGVESSPLLAAACQRSGLDVACDDPLTALRLQADHSCSVISGHHLVERLPFPLLFALVGETLRALKPGGMLLLETANPESALPAHRGTVHDPARLGLIWPQHLAFMARYHGFEGVEIIRRNPDRQADRLAGDSLEAARINEHFYGPRDYVLLAYKPGGNRPHTSVADESASP